jgi:urease accessory protein UreH
MQTSEHPYLRLAAARVASGKTEIEARRDAAALRVRRAAQADGLSPRMVQEIDNSTRAAFAMGDFLTAIGGKI